MAKYSRLKAAGLPKTSAKFAKMAKGKSLPKISKTAPKNFTPKSFKNLNFSKYVKTKVPKVTKVKLIKTAIKKAKFSGF